MPQHSAERLCLSEVCHMISTERLRLDENERRQSLPGFKEDGAGKAKPYRHVLR